MRKIVKRLMPSFIWALGRGFYARLNAERWGIEQFLQASAAQIRDGAILLDAGAGSGGYKKHFEQCAYQSTDITSGFSLESHRLSYLSELHYIPVRDCSYDVIVNTQVLEHVEYPQQVLNEFNRILKPDGSLYLTTPQSWGIHMAPYHFYNFTRYGLESLFRNANFEIVSITPIGGIFWNLAKIVSKMPRYIIDEFRKNRSLMARAVIYPFYLVFKPLCEYVIPFVFFYLDRVDTHRGWTIGYVCECRKRG